MTLEGEGKEPYRLAAGDAFVIPPGEAWALADPSPDLALLHVTTSRMPPHIPVAA